MGMEVAAPPAAAMDTVQYFAQMNEVALMSGFRNAQEMIASQKEMMSIMQGGPAVPMPAMMPQHIQQQQHVAPHPHYAPFRFPGARHYNARGRGRGREG